MTLAVYLNKPWAEKILLVEIDAAGPSPIYLADTAYITEPADVPASMPYASIIAPDGLPRLTRRIQEVWGGRSMPTWGPLQLVAPMAGSTNLATAALRGKSIQVLVTGPRAAVARADAAVVLSGIIGGRSGNIDEGVALEVLDRKAVFDGVELPAARYDAATMGGGFPAENHGKSKPLCLGTCRNISPVLIDAGTYTYQVHDGAVNAISQVYDDGVAVAYTPTAAAGTFVLAAPPVGVITADVQGALNGAIFLSSTTQIVDWLARTYGDLSAGEIDISGLPAEAIGLYLDAPTTLGETITRLMRGVIGWWGFDRANKLRARLFAAPTAGGQSFGETQQLADLAWEEDADIFWSIPVRYARNWTHIEQPAGAVALGAAAWLRSDGYDNRIEDAAILSSYATATTAPLLETYFDAQAPADAVAARALVLFGTVRRRPKTTVPIGATPLELGDSATLADASYLDGHWRIVGIAERWDAEVPLADLELWG